MLRELRLRGLGVIEEAVVSLGAGLTVVTGETGAGKTMVVQGLSLLFGGRADAGRVRPGHERTEVDGVLDLPEGHAALARVREAGGETEAGELLLGRSVTADGRSRAFAGGRTVPAAVLAEVAGSVLAVHGQSDQIRLLRPAQQRNALDRFGGTEVLEPREAYARVFADWRGCTARLAALREEAAARATRAEELRDALGDVEAVDPQPGEIDALAQEITVLGHAHALKAAAGEAQAALTGDEEDAESSDALVRITHARRALELEAGHDPRLEELAGRVREVAGAVSDIAAELASYAAGVDADPARLALAQERLAALTALLRRRGEGSLDDLLDWVPAASRELLDLDSSDEQVGALALRVEALAGEMAERGGTLTRARVEAGERFGHSVSGELKALAMPHSRVLASVRPTTPGPSGADEVEILLEPHEGAPARALHKGASGGELSRVMLAVEVVLAGSDPLPLLVFDEVDAGVGGRAAVEVGRRLASLGRSHQVLVVTHLAQVAAFADHHLVVVKSSDGSVTSSGVLAVDGDARVAELSRMLAGHDSELARAHAEELLAAASAAKAPSP